MDAMVCMQGNLVYHHVHLCICMESEMSMLKTKIPWSATVCLHKHMDVGNQKHVCWKTKYYGCYGVYAEKSCLHALSAGSHTYHGICIWEVMPVYVYGNHVRIHVCSESYLPRYMHMGGHASTGWQRLIGCLTSQVICRKRATSCRAHLRKMTYKDKAS